MKSEECRKARYLRKKGFSVREIAQRLNCSKSSISKWVRDILLTPRQIERLISNQDKGRAKAAQHPNSPKKKWEKIRSDIIEKSSREMPRKFSKLHLKILGTALYWAEGYNASRAVVLFSNSDPIMIKLMMLFFKKSCKVPNKKIKGRVNIHPHLNIKKAEKFWMNITKIPRKNFNKPLLSVSKASQQKRNSLPLGTFNIIISDVRIASKIKGWIKTFGNWAVGAVGSASDLHSEGS